MANLDAYMDELITLLMGYAPKLVMALVTLVVGLWIVKIVLKGLLRAMDRANIDISLRRFIESLASVLLKAVLLISVATMIGFETTSFVAVLGAAGLAIGLALQGSLSNFAGGVLILLFKPFKVGDLLEAQGHLLRHA